MKVLLLLVLQACLIHLLAAQGRYEKVAMADADRMTSAYNQKEFVKYVEYLLPSEYDNDTTNKKGLAKLFSQMTDTSKLEVIKLLKLKTINGEKQAVFLHRFRQRNGYILGVLKNGDKHWCFSQPMSQDVQFDLLLSMIPSLDTAFSVLIDPKYGKRIKFTENQTIPAFQFTDIQGSKLSSKDLTGKMLVLNFWSITCGPCIREMPQLNELVESMKNKDVVFIAPAFYSPRDFLLQKFLPKHPFAYNIVEITNPDDYSVYVFPTHIVTDRNHTIIYKAATGNSDNIKELSRVIHTALNK